MAPSLDFDVAMVLLDQPAHAKYDDFLFEVQPLNKSLLLV